MKERIRLNRNNGWDLVKVDPHHMPSSNQILTRGVKKLATERKYYHKLKKIKNYFC
jgi:hypothetical protein